MRRGEWLALGVIGLILVASYLWVATSPLVEPINSSDDCPPQFQGQCI